MSATTTAHTHIVSPAIPRTYGTVRGWTLAALTAILLVAATRILNIDGPSLWIDEGFTFYTFQGDLFELVKNDRHPPFYFYSLHAWASVAGESLLALRFWSFLPTMVSVAILYQIGRELARERDLTQVGVLSVPVLAALMMTLADGENFLAQELRMYSWQVMFCAGATWLYLRWMRQPNRLHGFGWVAFMTLALYTHYFSIYPIAAYGLHALIFLRGRHRVSSTGLIMLTGTLFLPWFFIVLEEQFLNAQVCLDCENSFTLASLNSFRVSWFGEQWILMLLLALLGLLTVTYRTTGIPRLRLTSVRGTSLLLLLIIAPFLGSLVITHTAMQFLNHHFAQLTVPIVLLFALGLSNIQRPARAVLVVMIAFYGVTHVDWYYDKAPWQELVANFAPYVEDDHLVLAEIGAENTALWFHLDAQLPEGVQIGLNPYWGNRANPEFYQETLPAIIAAQDETQRGDVTTAWLVHWNASRTMFDYLDTFGYVRTMQTSETHTGGIDLPAYRYDSLPPTPHTRFENGMTLHAVEITAGRVDLWWSFDSAPTGDYVTSVLLYDADGTLVTQADSQPQNGTRPTSGFEVREVVYDPKPLAELPTGTYIVAVQVYRFVDNMPQNVPTVDGETRVEVGRLDLDE